MFLTLDTQGLDARVLEGLGSQLERVVALQSDVSVRPIYPGMLGSRESIQRLNDAGFELSGLFCVSRDAEPRIGAASGPPGLWLEACEVLFRLRKQVPLGTRGFFLS